MGIKGLPFILSTKHLIPQFLVICSVIVTKTQALLIVPLTTLNIFTSPHTCQDGFNTSRHHDHFNSKEKKREQQPSLSWHQLR